MMMSMTCNNHRTELVNNNKENKKRVNKRTTHTSQSEEKQSNQLHCPLPGNHSTRQNPPNTAIRQRAGHIIPKTKQTKQIQSNLVISNSKGLSEILRDIRTSTYQICRIEEKITRTTTFMCNWTPEVRDILKMWKRGEIAISPLFLNIFLPVVRFSCLGRDQIFTSR